ncbi:hypothetical protein [Agrobacterium vitis]|uniref:hypothetical protein n=1 Tax=Agrobacterium vitis TaxID=373 RepID=UPI0015737566|nr:hypothetical protein [Agrobacterium vitis]NSZ19217.1 hypothetical protein [Agrobacterium vitis]QZO06094.1 hypothetical protein K4831_20785 [Agrobacterium vitis]UJL90416.1 hypothetical protein AVF2S5_20820 [Agrobacterium vitis]
MLDKPPQIARCSRNSSIAFIYLFIYFFGIEKVPTKLFLVKSPDSMALDYRVLPLLRVKIEYARLNFRDSVTASGILLHRTENRNRYDSLRNCFRTRFIHNLVPTFRSDALGAAPEGHVPGNEGANGLPEGMSVAVTGRFAATYFARSGHKVQTMTRDPTRPDVLSERRVASVGNVPDAAASSADTFDAEIFDAAFNVTGGLVNWLDRHLRTGGTLALAGFSTRNNVQMNALALVLRLLRLIGVNAGLRAVEKMQALSAVSKVLLPGDYDRIAYLGQPQDVTRPLRGFGESSGCGRILAGLR